MTISVIIPVYNCAKYLSACLDSVLAQTHRELQIIIIDDGSTDGSGDICDRYAALDCRIQVIHQANQGVSAARNVGLSMAEGEMIAFVDADDTVMPDMYEMLIALAHEHQADIVHCGHRKMHLDGSYKDVLGTGVLMVQNGQEACGSLLTGKLFSGGLWNKLYRHSLFEGIQFDTELKINEDVLINVELFIAAKKIVFRDLPKYCYYERKESATHTTRRMKSRRDAAVVAERILKLLADTPLDNIAAQRVMYTLLDLYRACLMSDVRGTRAERRSIHKKIKMLSARYSVKSSSQFWNYRFMRWLPKMYVLVYRLYNKIHVKNYDL